MSQLMVDVGGCTLPFVGGTILRQVGQGYLRKLAEYEAESHDAVLLRASCSGPRHDFSQRGAVEWKSQRKRPFPPKDAFDLCYIKASGK